MDEKGLRTLEYDKVLRIIENYAKTEDGRRKIRETLPRLDLDEIITLQQETSEAFSILSQKGSPPLRDIKDVRVTIIKAQKGIILSPVEVIRVGHLLAMGEGIKKFSLEDRREDAVYPQLDSLVASIHEEKALRKEIERCILSEEEISDDASQVLRSIRKAMKDKSAAIKAKLNQMIVSSEFSKYLQENLVTIRGDRYVLPIKQEHRGNVKGIVHDQSSSGATLFIEPISIVNLNNDLRELELKERDEIQRILSDFSDRIGEIGEELILNNEIAASIDYMFAKAHFSADYKCCEPSFNKERYIRLKNARHPLLDSKSVVPISLSLGKEFTTLVITGPNTGGKTVTLKTVGLLTLLGQAGFHIPADYGSELGIFDGVYADIGDEQSIEQSLSTFSSHMTNIVRILENITMDSLVLFDELGAGTDPTEGAALAMAILESLRASGIRTMATTHYSELKEYAITKPRVENASAEFDVDTLSPTYRLLVGIPGKSNAFEISKRLGLKDNLIDKAKELLSHEAVRFEELLAEIHKNREQAQRNRDEAIKLKLDADTVYRRNLDKEKKLEERKDSIVSKAKEEALKILENAKEEADEIIKNLRNIEFANPKELNQEIESNRRLLLDNITNLESKMLKRNKPLFKSKPEKLKNGDRVKLIDLGSEGTLLSDPENGEVLVQAGIMKVKLKIEALQKIDTKEETKVAVSTYKKKLNFGNTVSMSLDLRGQNLEDATFMLDKYLDEAFMAGHKTVTIIHGVGTGVLMSGLKEAFRRHKHINTFRKGNYGEGGAGVTIVEFN